MWNVELNSDVEQNDTDEEETSQVQRFFLKNNSRTIFIFFSRKLKKSDPPKDPGKVSLSNLLRCMLDIIFTVEYFYARKSFHRFLERLRKSRI